MRRHAARRMWALGAALVAVVVLWGAVAWSRPRPPITVYRAASARTSGATGERRRAEAPERAEPRSPTDDDVAPVTAAPQPVARPVQPAPAVRVLPAPVAPVTQTTSS